MDIKQTLADYKRTFDPVLEKYLNEQSVKYGDISDFTKYFFDVAHRYILPGGKRIRPTLMLSTYLLFRKKEDPKEYSEVQKISLLTEIIHAFLLIHDDIMDKDDLRHGVPTVHKVFEMYAEEKGYKNIKHFGTSFAILLGDMLHSLAYDIVLNSALSDGKKIMVCTEISRYVPLTIFGQNHDLLLSFKDECIEKEIDTVLVLKTAKYTFETPMLLGAKLAGADPKQLEAISEYALAVGKAFQIRDDILGVFGDQETTGKSASSDIREGKKTLLVYQAYLKATPSQRKLLGKVLGNSGASEKDISEVRNIFRESGALAHVNEHLSSLVKTGQKVLDIFPSKDSEHWSFFKELAEFMIVREG